MDNEKKRIRRIKKKADRTAAGELIAKYYKEIYAFVYKQLLHKETAMDLTQEIFTGVLQSIQSFNGEKASFCTWLYRIASNHIVDYYRSKTYKNTQLIDHMEDRDFPEEVDFTLTLEYQQDVERIMVIVESFEAKAQQIFRLKLFADRTFAEIAEIITLPDSTVKANYYASIRRIKQKFEEVQAMLLFLFFKEDWIVTSLLQNITTIYRRFLSLWRKNLG
ncbi:RNA polymerase sigma factor [Paenibacillus sp. IHBB 10380]|uniref:RNA polymerase sigma factor n=1 Tax=Paenibacillus sp. IHBB 10380 TaxID=1566358 RepID=UPI0009E38044|nr:sigma-70 family RNA polymerase sigma factor [Paenibacillus sp. IHBB 10380]